jgi:hypothetical protein
LRADVLVSQLFDEWAASWARGERPDPRTYLQRAGHHRDELTRMMDAYLQLAPRPEPDPDRVELVQAWLRGESPLVDLRARRGLKRDDVVDSLLQTLGLAAGKRPFLSNRYHELEAGLLEPGRLSERLVVSLAGVLRTTEDVIRTWRPRKLQLSVAYRTTTASAAPTAPARVEERDPEVDALFLSGD